VIFSWRCPWVSLRVLYFKLSDIQPFDLSEDLSGVFSNGSVWISEDFLNESMNEVDPGLFRQTGVPRTSRLLPPPSFRYAATINVSLQRLGIQLSALCIIPMEAFVRVRDGDTTIASTLESTEDA
jgi:hypothetical protein